jgi:hypothetical protein
MQIEIYKRPAISADEFVKTDTFNRVITYELHDNDIAMQMRPNDVDHIIYRFSPTVEYKLTIIG